MSREDRVHLYMAFNCLEDEWSLSVKGASLDQRMPLLEEALISIQKITIYL